MFWSIIAYFLKRWLARHLSQELADKLVVAAAMLIAEIKAKGDKAVLEADDEAVVVGAKEAAVFAFRKMTPEEEKRWMDRMTESGG